MAKRDDKKVILKQVGDYLTGGKEEMSYTRKVFKDKVNGQVALRLPKDIYADKIDENSEFIVVLNPTEKTWEEIKKQKTIIYIKEKKK